MPKEYLRAKPGEDKEVNFPEFIRRLTNVEWIVHADHGKTVGPVGSRVSVILMTLRFILSDIEKRKPGARRDLETLSRLAEALLQVRGRDDMRSAEVVFGMTLER